MFLSMIVLQASGQKPETIYSIAHVIKPNEFYLEQIGLWKKEIQKDEHSAAAWFNYYKANRYAHISGGHDSVASRKRFERMKGIVDEIQEKIPGTWEAHFIKWANGYNNWDLLPDLKRAYEIDSSRIETYDGFINLYEVNRDLPNRDKFLNKWYASGTVSPGLLNYNYNVLRSLKPNAILITGGDNDTYFAWMLQAVMGVRKDVTIVNSNLCGIKSYGAKLSRELGLAQPLPNTDDFSYEDYAKVFFKSLITNKDRRPVYAAATADEIFTLPVEQNLYLIGLAYEYSEDKMDNMALLKKNLEREYALDYLNQSFGIDTYETVVACANTNYLVPMITLYKHYRESGDAEKAAYWKSKAILVANKCGKAEDMSNYFKD